MKILNKIYLKKIMRYIIKYIIFLIKNIVH